MTTIAMSIIHRLLSVYFFCIFRSLIITHLYLFFLHLGKDRSFHNDLKRSVQLALDAIRADGHNT